jgi:predicted house-cleaning noncanonical NTP pyrophosphatase (MazG superfamily)
MREISYEQQALECRKLASEMKDPTRKKQMEDMADVWEMLAQQQQANNNPESAPTETA